MFGRMCLLEKIPTAFDAYTPPTGINVAWYHDFAGKENDNQVIAFFTAVEISLNKDHIAKDGDILKEVQNNRCFAYIRTIPQSQWAAIIPNFDYGGEVISMPADIPDIDPNWHPVEQYEEEIDEESFNKINKIRENKQMPKLEADPKKVREIKASGEQVRKKVKVPYFRFIDIVRAEK